ncbi:hypothetical protein MLD38_017894 [Melastoma candidum]|uniref:Uncharacterized protein n=1 Tax=Melastoma candidum TaxID=119954 RepID=A0ACB9R0C8_9MYRT|nr:hypothetical protein MLD38_017894 [Melastoma candidum]
MAQNQSNWEADKMLDVYIYDYLMKRKLVATAKSFMNEGKVSPDPVAIDAPGGFLFEWWSVFWDIFIARTNEKHSEAAAAYIEVQQGKAREQHQQQQRLQMQELQLIRQGQMPRRDPAQPTIGGPTNAANSEGILGQPTASALAAKLYEDRMKIDGQASQPLLDGRLSLLKSSSNHPGQLVQGNSANVTAALQQIQDIKGEVNMSGIPRSLPMNPSAMYGQGIVQPRPVVSNSGMNQGGSEIPLKGWPLLTNHYANLSDQQQQQILNRAQGNASYSSLFAEMDPRVFRGMPRGTLTSKEGQVVANDGSAGSPIQSTSSKMQQPASQQQQEPLQPQQAPPQTNRKRKGLSSSGPANSTGTGNTIGPSPNSQPSTPSTHTPGDGFSMASNVQQAASMSKGIMMYGANGLGGLTSSTNPLDDIENFAEVASLDDNVESFLSQDDGDGRDVFGKLKQNPSEPTAEPTKGLSFNEVGSMRKSNSKVVCCHFSTDGKYLASAGHDKKVIIWNMETLQTESTPEEHTHIITDVRFRPNTTQLATSSFDTTVRIWDASQPSYCLQTYSGHTSKVMSVDFHPKKNDVFCSCDSNSEIRFWSINQYSSTNISKGGASQVRFQPRIGQLLAAAANNGVPIFDVEMDRQTYVLKGHLSEVLSLCWDNNGEYLASVSPESVRVWRISSGECVHELSSSGNKYQSCVFHPSYPNSLLVIGGYQSLELWNVVENKCMTMPAHECVISALSQSAATGMVASASYDKSVKIWK